MENDLIAFENLFPQNYLKMREDAMVSNEYQETLKLFFVKSPKKEEDELYYLTNSIVMSINIGRKIKLDSNFCLGSINFFFDISIICQKPKTPTYEDLALISTDLKLMN